METLPSLSDNKNKLAAKSILEADGKTILKCHLTSGLDQYVQLVEATLYKPTPLPPTKLVSLYCPEDTAVASVLDQAESTYPWLFAKGARFVAKPAQLINWGKSGLLVLNITWAEA